ncbi:hypothetical protein [Planotetraspora mira]|nr:hypothetical protein [Planotetraspora mira]
MSDEMALAGAKILDTSADLPDRVAALGELANLDAERAIQIAINVTENAEEPSDVLIAMGKELARIASNSRWLTEFEVRNIGDAAFEAYCEHLK